MSEWQTVLQVATPVLVGIVGGLLKRSISEVDKKLDAHDGRITDLEKTRATVVSQDRQDERIERVELDMVNKEDWLRESGITRQRLDKTLEGIARLEGKQDQTVEISAAIAAALNAQRSNR